MLRYSLSIQQSNYELEQISKFIQGDLPDLL